MSGEEVLRIAGERGVKFVRLQFLDILGVAKNVAISLSQLPRALANEVAFDGSSIEGFTRIEESDMYLRPVPESFAVFPWSTPDQVEARLICDVYTPDGEPFAGDPRGALRRVKEKAAGMGYTVNVGPECEFFLFKQADDGRVSTLTHDRGGYFDLSPVDKGEEARRQIVLHLEEMGFEVEASHHETAPGQHEIDLRYTDVLASADRVVTLRMVTRAVADYHGLRATFMPKPLVGVDGSGLHTHVSLFADGRNAFYDPGGFLGLNQLALHFIGGLMAHARAITALTNPLVNSYKRLVPGFEAPAHLSWSPQNRSALIRVPSGRGQGTRIEFRSPDPSCNPYLAFAVMIQAGLDGIERRLEPPEPVMGNVHHLTRDGLAPEGLRSMPSNLREALDEMIRSELVRETLGEHIFQHFLAAKTIEWDIYRTQVHEWELGQYLCVF